MVIGNLVQQPAGYKAFIPDKFPPAIPLLNDEELVRLLSRADISLGKLDGITQTIPNIDFFIFMYVRKEAALSSEIEGTQATMIDSIEAELDSIKNLPKDVNDILHYIEAMNYGLKRLESLPLSLRLVREVHKVLMIGARTSFHSDPGEFRKSPNWIGGSSPSDARFVPPSVEEMHRALNDFEKFLHDDNNLPVLIKTGLAHAQFETIHPFLDGNGRTGRLLVTFYLCHQNVLGRPVLYLSEFFKRQREQYFNKLNDYHEKDDIIGWLKFFLRGVAEVADKAFNDSKKINELYKKDLQLIQDNFRSSKAPMKILQRMYELPRVNVKKIQEWTGFSRDSANDLVNKLVKIGILVQVDKRDIYARVFEYKEYLDIFRKEAVS